jgi:hypothetical protein
LVQALTLFEAQTSAQKSDLTEQDERHLRILAMLIKSLDGFAEGAVFSKTSPIRFEVAQISSRHGAGFSRLLEI